MIEVINSNWDSSDWRLNVISLLEYIEKNYLRVGQSIAKSEKESN